MTPGDREAVLERTVLSIIQSGHDRCGAGFGKYPLGVLDAVHELVKVIDSARIQERLADFQKRLEG